MSNSQVKPTMVAREPDPFDTCDAGHCHVKALVAVHTESNFRLTFCGHHFDDVVRKGALFVAVCDTRYSY